MNAPDDAIDVSQKILRAIQHADLEKVALLEQEWTSLIEGYFSSGDDLDLQQTQQLKQLNDEILIQLTDMQSTLKEQRAKLIKGSRASNAYLDNL